MVKQLLILHQQSKVGKTITRLLGISKNTVKACQAAFYSKVAIQCQQVDDNSLSYLRFVVDLVIVK